MRIFVGQIYVEPGISFPFTLHFQKWLGHELTGRVEVSEKFKQTYPGDFDVVFRISSKSEIEQPEVKGPTVFRKEKSIEFTIFLPYRDRALLEVDRYRSLIEQLLDSIIQVLKGLGIEPRKVEDIAERFMEDPAMIKKCESKNRGQATFLDRNTALP